MPILNHLTTDGNMRDPLSQWLQSANDPQSSEAQESVRKAEEEYLESCRSNREVQRTERLKVLEEVMRRVTEAKEPVVQRLELAHFDRLFLNFLRDDPEFLHIMSARLAARGMVRANQARGKWRQCNSE